MHEAKDNNKGLMKQYFVNAKCIRPTRAYKLGIFFKAIAFNNSFYIM